MASSKSIFRCMFAYLYIALFFLHLANENKHHRVTNKINNRNKYLSPTVNKDHSDRYRKRRPILSSRIEHLPCWTIKSDDFIGRQNRPTLSIVDPVNGPCRSSGARCVPRRLVCRRLRALRRCEVSTSSRRSGD